MNKDYIIALVILLAIYTAALYLMKYFGRSNLCEYIFMALVFIPYVCLSIKVYCDVGFYDWNFQNTLPSANVSPFMFSLIPILLFIPKKRRAPVLALISFLSVGMLLSTVISCVSFAAINYKFHFHFVLDYVAHLSLSLFGIYLVRCERVRCDKISLLFASAIIFSAATVMLLLNLIFDTAFFGLSLRGKHNIYNNVIVESSYLSAFLYYLGLLFVLLAGFFASRLFSGARFIIKNRDKE